VPPGGGDAPAAGERYNPNGSMGDIAGLCDRTGRVLGLMPHPERFISGTQHPTWTARPPRETGDGLAFFQCAVEYFA
jgi:phosphoribosylformylglycinamidine synthase